MTQKAQVDSETIEGHAADSIGSLQPPEPVRGRLRDERNRVIDSYEGPGAEALRGKNWPQNVEPGGAGSPGWKWG